MRFISGLFGLALIIAIVQTASAPKTRYEHLAGGGWIAFHPDGTYETLRPKRAPEPAARPVPAAGRDI